MVLPPLFLLVVSHAEKELEKQTLPPQQSPCVGGCNGNTAGRPRALQGAKGGGKLGQREKEGRVGRRKTRANGKKADTSR